MRDNKAGIRETANRGGPRGLRSLSDGETKKTDLAPWEIQQGNGWPVRSEMSLVIFGRSRSSPSFLRRWESNKATTTGDTAYFPWWKCGQIELWKLRWSSLSCRGNLAVGVPMDGLYVQRVHCNLVSSGKSLQGMFFILTQPIGWPGTAVSFSFPLMHPPTAPAFIWTGSGGPYPDGKYGKVATASPTKGVTMVSKRATQSSWTCRNFSLSMISISHSDPQYQHPDRDNHLLKSIDNHLHLQASFRTASFSVPSCPQVDHTSNQHVELYFQGHGRCRQGRVCRPEHGTGGDQHGRQVDGHPAVRR